MTIEMLKGILERRGIDLDEITLHDGRVSIYIETVNRNGRRVSISWIFADGLYCETFPYIYPGAAE